MKNSKQFKMLVKILPWLICGLAAVFYSYEYFLRITPSVMTVDLMHYYQLNAGSFGILSALYYYAYMPMQLPVGILMDRYGPRRLLTLACALCVIGTYFFVATQSVVLAGIGRFLVGFGSAFAFVGVLKLATVWLPANRLALVAGLASALGTLGGMFGTVFLTAAVQSVGWRSTMNYAAASGVLLTALLWLFLRDSADSETIKKVKKQGVDFQRILYDVVLIMKNKQIWVNGLIGCFLYLPTTVFAELWGIPYLEQAYQFSPEQAAIGISALFWGFTIGGPLAGAVSDKIRQRRLPLFVGAIGAAILFAVLLYLPGIPRSGVYLLLFSIGALYSTQVIVFAIGRELSPDEAAGTAIATTNMLVMVGGALFQPLVGLLLDIGVSKGVHVYSANDYRAALTIIPIGILIAAGLTFLLRETHSKVMEE